ncbi:toll/interleukin-1 receptor domain-containing adapter protein [Tiliqua scincoides]|uniref:toll/interleukin-1 receptor domain-containing adapter protein n=1 Tax=Tiliqua scincoides TaxID=71010 RepID=UPI0034624FFD
MADWFRQLLMKTRNSSNASRSNFNSSTKYSPTPPSVRNSSSVTCSSGNGPNQVSAASQVCSSDSARWRKPYDVCICHNEEDFGFVEGLVSYLESQPEQFRCFLQPRDSAPGAAIVTELCDAVQNSHCWVLLITPNFLKDPWCRYQMHHALTEAPMANGRTIPLLKDIDRKDYPRELRCIYYISVTLQENSFRQVKEAVMRYLQELCQNTSSNS